MPSPRTPADSVLARDFRRKTLRPGGKQTARALAEAFFAEDGDVPAERLDAFVEDLDAFVSPASKTLRFGLVAMLFLIRWSPLLFGRMRTFESLSCGERVRHLERLERSKVAQLPLLVVAYKTVMTMLFYEDEEELRSLGYPGTERKRWTRGLPVAR